MKTKSLIAGIIIAAACVTPFATSALSIEDLQQQIKNLLSQVATLQAQIKSQREASSTPAVQSQKIPRICALINRNLSRGQSGDDVRGLQEFLSGEGFLNASATGFFGPATAQALATWQAKNNISALGSFGPLSRARLKMWCGNGGNSGTRLMTVSPQTGTAPLTVTVTAYTGDASDYQPSMADGRDTMIDFGDGSARQWVHCATTQSNDNNPSRCQSPQIFTHTYSSDGSYTVSLVKSGGMCMGGCADETIATEKVVVGNVSSTARLNADPSTGGAPLTVNFSGSIGINDATPIIDFGDGQTGTVTKGSCIGIAAIIGGTGGIRCSLSANHTYTANGTYTAKLVNASNTSIASATVSVGDTASSGTLVADPQNGNAPLPVAFTYQPGQENGTYWIEFGDGEGQIMHLRPIYCIRAPCISPVGAEHTYKNAGTYEVYVSTYIACMHTNPRCMIATIPLAKTTVTVTGGTSSAGAPVISSFSGPVTLAVNEIGTWSITASDPENGTLKYSILWGDEWTASDAAQRAMAPQASIQQNTTFTHSYSNAGNYTVALTVTDSDGKQARSTATVQVSQTACTKEYKPVCGRPNGCANTCAPGMYCTMQCQLYEPQTYSNRCVMNNSNATFMHEGACTGNEGYLQ